MTNRRPTRRSEEVSATTTDPESASDCRASDARVRAAAAEPEVIWTAIVLHELRQPLTRLTGYAQLMRRRATYDPHALESILRETQRLRHLVDDRLDVASLAAGRLPLRPGAVDLVALAETQVEQAQALSARHTLRLEAPERPLVGWWDPHRLGQVLANLLENAIKYSPAGGEILCRVEHAGAGARMAVVDHGLGIPAATLPRLFELFYRTESGVASGIPGFGLGLYLTKLLVEAHRGCIAVESEVGQGSTFTVSLPYQRAER
jgi:signal transduction histidine kinase